MTMPTKKEIESRLLGAYLSFAQPSFRFQARSLSDRPYRDIVDELAGISYIHETTDVNTDVSFCYEVRSVANEDVGPERLFLQMSMIGPYALMTGGDPRKPRLVNKPTTSFESSITGILDRHGLSILPIDILLARIPIKLFCTAEESVTFYHALFSDSDVIPFEHPVEGGKDRMG